MDAERGVALDGKGCSVLQSTDRLEQQQNVDRLLSHAERYERMAESHPLLDKSFRVLARCYQDHAAFLERRMNGLPDNDGGEA